MSLRISCQAFFATPLALALVTSSLACSSSGSSSATGDDAGSTPDSSTTSTTPDSSTTSTTPDSSTTSTTPDSSTTSTTPDSSTASTTPDSSTPTEDAGALSFSTDIYAPIIEHHCVGCHGFTSDGGAGPGIAFGKLDLSSADAGYVNLVNVAAAGVACGDADGGAPIRVVPGSAATSLLYEKVNGFTTPPPCGHAMPESGEIADGGQAIVVQQVETWINEGALP